jgi:hypothetical protein
MSLQKYKRVDLALNQFETAVALFLAKRDYFSVITLAGAADVIFCQVITRKGADNFTEIVAKEEGKGRSCQELGKEINDMFFINQLKHMDPDEDGYIEFDPCESACGAILKGLVNYKMLAGHNIVIDDFLVWVRANLDPNVYNIHCDPNWTPIKKDLV